MPANIDSTNIEQIHKETYRRLEEAYTAEFHRRKIGTPDAEFHQQPLQGVYLTSLLNLAAMLAVDVGMPSDRFLAIASETFDNQFRDAPRFG